MVRPVTKVLVKKLGPRASGDYLVENFKEIARLEISLQFSKDWCTRLNLVSARQMAPFLDPREPLDI
ncbi:hypothetical protein MRX96_022028 [Rhipicephalus microplus]